MFFFYPILPTVPSSFHDKMTQRTFERKLSDRDNARKNFLAGDGRIITERPNTKPRIYPAYAKTVEEATKAGCCLLSLAQLPALNRVSEGLKLSAVEIILSVR